MNKNAYFADLTAGLPPDVIRLAAAGRLTALNTRIGDYLGQSRIPAAGKRALLAVRQIMARMADNFPLTRAEALDVLRTEVPDFSDAEFDALLDAGRIDWRYVEGEPRYMDDFADSLRMYPDMLARGLRPDPDSGLRDGVIAAMQKDGHLAADITIRAAIAPAKSLSAGADTPCKAWLPLPAACEEQSAIEILEMTPGGVIAPEDAEQRTVFWDARVGDGPFYVTYRYHIDAPLVDMDALTPDVCQPDFDTEEQAPHIVFTPYLRALAAEITAGKRGPLEKARAIYDYVTLNIKYRYQPAYAVMPAIAENCAKTGYGDCGVMALLFITLCRISGIPARWQSGLYVTPTAAGCHDWAQFYLAPHGWLWADCSFGSGAHRMGNETRRRHYFGNLDPLRMVANRRFYAPLTPPDEEWRNDPYDNQRGELQLDGRGLMGGEMERSSKLVEYRTEKTL